MKERLEIPRNLLNHFRNLKFTISLTFSNQTRENNFHSRINVRYFSFRGNVNVAYDAHRSRFSFNCFETVLIT